MLAPATGNARLPTVESPTVGGVLLDDERQKTAAVCAQRAKTSAKSSKPKVIQDLHPNFRINPDSDPDVCRIAPKMIKNLKFPIPQW